MDELAEVMHRDTRINIVKVLILMRNKGLIDVIPLLKSFFNYFRINDKQLLIWKQGNTMLVQVEAVGAFGMRTETRLLASLPAR